MRGGAGMTAVPDMLHDTWQEQLSWQGWPYRLLRLEWQLDHAAAAWQPFTCLHAHLLAGPPACMHTCQPASMHTCLQAHLSACTPANLPACPPACMPTWLHTHLPACPPSCKPTCLHAHLTACPPDCSACLSACHHSFAGIFVLSLSLSYFQQHNLPAWLCNVGLRGFKFWQKIGMKSRAPLTHKTCKNTHTQACRQSTIFIKVLGRKTHQTILYTVKVCHFRYWGVHEVAVTGFLGHFLSSWNRTHLHGLLSTI